MIRSISPDRLEIHGAVTLPRTLHADPRGFLVETMRSDDWAVAGSEFAMSYTSVTIPGQMRDRDRWHVHRHQSDRFVVPMGEMILMLYDGRTESPTAGRLAAIRMAGLPFDRVVGAAGGESITTHLVTIPPGVYHCIGNLHPRDPFVLQNYPTRLYDAADEGRVPFVERPIASLGGQPFAWEQVEVDRT